MACDHGFSVFSTHLGEFFFCLTGPDSLQIAFVMEMAEMSNNGCENEFKCLCLKCEMYFFQGVRP